MNYSELKEKVDQFVETLPTKRVGTQHLTDREIGKAILLGFLWWLYPQMKPKDLPSYEKVPLTKLGPATLWGITSKQIPVPSYPSRVEVELYGIRHPERCPPGDPMCPQPEEVSNERGM